MRAFGTLWWRVFGVLTVLATLYLSLTAADVLWWLIALVGIAVLVAGTILGAPRVSEWLRILRVKYPALVKRAGALEEEILRARAEWQAERIARPEAFDRGRLEGARELLGSIMALEVGEPVELTGKAVEDGELVLFAKCSLRVRLPARFYLEQVVGGTRKGVVEVVDSPPDGPIRLEVVEATVEEYWARIKDEAIGNSDPPGGVKLAAHDALDTYLSGLEPAPPEESDGADGN